MDSVLSFFYQFVANLVNLVSGWSVVSGVSFLHVLIAFSVLGLLIAVLTPKP